MAEQTLFSTRRLRLSFFPATVIIAKRTQSNEQHKANGADNGGVPKSKHIQGGDRQGIGVEGGKLLLGTEELMQHS